MSVPRNVTELKIWIVFAQIVFGTRIWFLLDWLKRKKGIRRGCQGSIDHSLVQSLDGYGNENVRLDDFGFLSTLSHCYLLLLLPFDKVSLTWLACMSWPECPQQWRPKWDCVHFAMAPGLNRPDAFHHLWVCLLVLLLNSFVGSSVGSFVIITIIFIIFIIIIIIIIIIITTTTTIIISYNFFLEYLLTLVQYHEYCSLLHFSKFVVYGCLLIFSLLFSLKRDGTITWSYWIIFLALWIWKSLVVIGAVVGSWVWWRHPHYRFELISLPSQPLASIAKH